MRRTHSLRTRLAFGYGLFFAAVLVLMSAGVYWLVRQALLTEVSQELAAAAELIQQDFAASAGPLPGFFSDPDVLLKSLPPRLTELDTPAFYVQVSDLDDQFSIGSASLRGQQLPRTPEDQTAAMGGSTTTRIFPLGRGRVIQLSAPLLAGGAVVGVLQVAQSLRPVDQTLQVLLEGLAITGLIALVAAVRGGVWIVSRSLGPVNEITSTARQIFQAADLARRVPAASAADEIGALADTINAMLERLESLFTAQRRFVADVSHELRTPLTAMRGHLELLQRGVVRDAEDQAEMTADLLREVNRLTRMANDLLLLAQAEVGLQLRCAPVALDDLVLEVVRELRPLGEGVAMRPQLAEQVAISGDRDRIKQALINLVANAIQHSPVDGTVTVALDQDGESAYLRVRDEGQGIAPEDLSHVFERFYRADRARAQRTGGAGLGLAIVQWVAHAHGGEVLVESALGSGAAFIIRLPLSREQETEDRG
ncbi:HAMP domain-containing histidine kinase [Chloroflexales bacterium ZM16-3]|nr:HAMP domain-containing histidine kinase [Chloroflexales bacterium ZM16-3]